MENISDLKSDAVRLVGSSPTQDILNLYPEYTTWYGPFTRKKDGRKHIALYNNITQKKTSISWPKVLMELHLNRRLLTNETVDHINENYTDDRIENLQLLSREENARKSALISRYVNCPCCKKAFHQYRKEQKFCSDSCRYAARRAGLI